jgi:hypothetical protein
MKRNCCNDGQISKFAHEKVPQINSKCLKEFSCFQFILPQFLFTSQSCPKSIILPSILLQSKSCSIFTSLLLQFCRKCFYFAKEKSKLSFELSLEQFLFHRKCPVLLVNPSCIQCVSESEEDATKTPKTIHQYENIYLYFVLCIVYVCIMYVKRFNNLYAHVMKMSYHNEKVSFTLKMFSIGKKMLHETVLTSRKCCMKRY